jgi:hypothetical protein
MLVLLYLDEVSAKMELLHHLSVFEDETDSEKIALELLLKCAQTHCDNTQPSYHFDWSNFLTERRAASEDDDYKYQVVTFG